MCGEFNFVADPEAAYIVLDRYTCPTYMGVHLQEQPSVGKETDKLYSKLYGFTLTEITFRIIFEYL